jgi:hypothetical protein
MEGKQILVAMQQDKVISAIPVVLFQYRFQRFR